jgi:hypothetical protein
VSDRLREAFLEGLGEPPHATAECPDAGRIWSVVRGELGAAESQALVDHALGCASCGTALRLAREIQVEATPHVVPRKGWRAAHWAAVAAGIVVALLIPVGLYEWRAPRPAPAVYREPGSEITPLVAEGQTLPRSAFVLRWSPGPESTRYSIRVLRSDLTVIASADGLENAEYGVPAEALREVAAGTTVYWRVEEHLPDGSHVVSDTFSVRLE